MSVMMMGNGTLSETGESSLYLDKAFISGLMGVDECVFMRHVVLLLLSYRPAPFFASFVRPQGLFVFFIFHLFAVLH